MPIKLGVNKPTVKKSFIQRRHCVVCGKPVKGHGFFAHKGLNMFFILPRFGYYYCSKGEAIDSEDITEDDLVKIERTTGWKRR